MPALYRFSIDRCFGSKPFISQLSGYFSSKDFVQAYAETIKGNNLKADPIRLKAPYRCDSRWETRAYCSWWYILISKHLVLSTVINKAVFAAGPMMTQSPNFADNAQDITNAYIAELKLFNHLGHCPLSLLAPAALSPHLCLWCQSCSLQQ